MISTRCCDDSKAVAVLVETNAPPHIEVDAAVALLSAECPGKIGKCRMMLNDAEWYWSRCRFGLMGHSNCEDTKT